MHILISAQLETGADEFIELCMTKMAELGADVTKDIHGDTAVIVTNTVEASPDVDPDLGAETSPEVPSEPAVVATAEIPADLPSPEVAPEEPAPAPAEQQNEFPPASEGPDTLIYTLSVVKPAKTILDPSLENSKLLSNFVQYESGYVQFAFAGFTFNLMTGGGQGDVANPNHPVGPTTIRVVMCPTQHPIAAMIDVEHTGDLPVPEDQNVLVIGRDLLHVFQGEVTDVPGE